MTQTRSLGRNAWLKAILNLFNLFVPLLVGPYVNGLLTPDDLGLYNRAFSEFQIFFLLGAFGIYNYGVRELSRVREDKNAVSRLFTSLLVIGLLSNLLVSLAFIAFFLLRARPGEWVVYSVLLLQMASNVFYIEFLNEAVENYRFITIKTILVRLGYLVGIFVFVRKADDVVPYALVISLTVLVNNLVSYVYVRRRVALTFKGLELRRHLGPLVVSLLLVNAEIMYSQVDRVLLGPWGHFGAERGDVTVTLYQLGFTLIGMLASVPAALLTVSMPRLSNLLARGDRAGYETTLTRSVETYLAILLPMSLGLAAVAPEALELYTRGVYTYGWPVLVLACFGRILYGLQFAVGSLLLYLHQAEKPMAILLGIGGLVNLLFKLGLLITDTLTPLTAMATTLAAVALYLVLAVGYSRRRLGCRVRLWSRRCSGYLLVSATFFAIRLGADLLPGGKWLHLAGVILVCGSLYFFYMLFTRDPLAERFLKRRGE